MFIVKLQPARLTSLKYKYDIQAYLGLRRLRDLIIPKLDQEQRSDEQQHGGKHEATPCRTCSVHQPTRYYWAEKTTRVTNHE